VKTKAKPMRVWVIFNRYGASNDAHLSKQVADANARHARKFGACGPYRIVEFIEVVKPKRKGKR